MPFIESSDKLRSKAHVSHVPTVTLVGVLVVAGVALVLFVGNVMSAANGAVFELEQETQHVADSQEASSNEAVQAGTSASEHTPYAYVFVSGAVASPGVYQLNAGARVNDAIKAAGGFAQGAATDYNNLAREVVDGEQIHVPMLDDLEGSQGQAAAPLAGPAAGSAGTASPQGLVNINTADATELESLPGVGPATAAKIIASRESEGPFATPDELMRVSGIGEKKFAAIADLICV